MDKTGRRMVYGNPHFRFAEIEEKDKARALHKNDYEGSLRGGLPHGFGTKIYAVQQSWRGCLWPFGTIFTSNEISGQLIRYADYLKEVGLLGKTTNPIILIDGEHTVTTMLDISRIMERLKLVNGQVSGLIVSVNSAKDLQDIGYHAKHSAYLETFKAPVVCVLKGQFEFEPLAWPTPLSIRERIPILHTQFQNPWLADNWWQMQASTSTAPTVTLERAGDHHLDKHGAFPLEPVGQFQVTIKWTGSEIYMGDFKEGAKHGKGIFVRSNGDKHVGHYLGGVAHGHGVYHWRNGDTWVGSWLHGRQDARGERRSADMQKCALLLQCNFRVNRARQEMGAIAKKEHTASRNRKVAYGET